MIILGNLIIYNGGKIIIGTTFYATLFILITLIILYIYICFYRKDIIYKIWNIIWKDFHFTLLILSMTGIRFVIILILFLTEYKTQNILYGFIWLNLISNIIEYIHSTWELRNIDIIYTYILVNGRKKELCVSEKKVCDIISAMTVMVLNIFLFMYYKEGYFLFYTIPTLFSVLSRYTKKHGFEIEEDKKRDWHIIERVNADWKTWVRGIVIGTITTIALLLLVNLENSLSKTYQQISIGFLISGLIVFICVIKLAIRSSKKRKLS